MTKKLIDYPLFVNAISDIFTQNEPVIDIVCPENASDSARLGWVLGNLHFPIEIHPGKLRVCDDQAIRQLLLRENYTYSLVDAVFQPLSGAHSHGL